MEASPLPFEQISKEYKEYKLESESQVFNVKIILSSNIILEIYELEKIKDFFYINEFSLEELIELNKIFLMCEKINEAYEILEEIFDNKRSSIKLKEDNSLILIINVGLPSGKTKEVELPLNKKEINKNKIIEELIIKVIV